MWHMMGRERPDMDAAMDPAKSLDLNGYGPANRTTLTAPSPATRTIPETSPARPGDELSDRDRQILTFERQWWKYAGAKEQAIRDQFAMSATRYYQVLNALIDRTSALSFDPLLVKRLRRLRSSRQRARAARRVPAHAHAQAAPSFRGDHRPRGADV
jgi:uncharacterized protein DUF3263